MMTSTLSREDTPVKRSMAFGVGLARRVGNLLLPPTCLSCDQPVGHQGTFCGACWQDIRFIERPYCEMLGSPFSYDLGVGALSARAIAEPPKFRKARAAVLFDGPARRLVHGLKFSDRTELAPWMAHYMVRASDGLLDGHPLVVPVPLHRWRLLSRRFNQAAELGRAVANRNGLDFDPHALVRVRPTPQQVGLDRKQRASNVRGAFRVPHSRQIAVKGRGVLLIDDVYTTGATLDACARALLRGGATHVDCLTFARVGAGVAVAEV